MIVAMSKVHIVARGPDRTRLLEALRDMGVVHLAPVDRAKAVAEENTVATIDRLTRAMQVLSNVTAKGTTPDISPAEAAAETVGIQRESAECRSRLTALHHQIQQLEIWGDVTGQQFAQLRRQGLDVKFLIAADELVGEIRAELVTVLADAGAKRSLVAVVDRGGQLELPDGVRPIPLPDRDRPSIRAEAAEIDARLARHSDRLGQLAHLSEQMARQRTALQARAAFTVARRGGLEGEHLFGIQGWMPAEKVGALAGALSRVGLDAGVQALEPEEDELPPTLIHYPRWARPIKGLFDILGTSPGYREMDLAPLFMIALPVFAAMLIGDAGYGLVFLIGPLFLYRRLVAAAGKAKVHLLMTVAVATIVWGVLTANYFGLRPETFARAGGYVKMEAGKQTVDYEAVRANAGGWACIARAMMVVAPFWRADSEAGRIVLIKISFLIGTLHLIIAHLRHMLALAPDIRALAEIGWCAILSAMLGVIWLLFFGNTEPMPVPLTAVWLAMAAGGALIVLFTAPSRNPLKMIGIGIVSSLLPLMGTFSDTISYIRLMAAGLATYYIADAFNKLGASLAESITWYSVLPVLVIVFGHLMNIGLAVIAIFAHGVRLNMLEFSNNAGVQWAGYPYEPFARKAD